MRLWIAGWECGLIPDAPEVAGGCVVGERRAMRDNSYHVLVAQVGTTVAVRLVEDGQLITTSGLLVQVQPRMRGELVSRVVVGPMEPPTPAEEIDEATLADPDWEVPLAQFWRKRGRKIATD